jgi:hypothetical protein
MTGEKKCWIMAIKFWYNQRFIENRKNYVVSTEDSSRGDNIMSSLPMKPTSNERKHSLIRNNLKTQNQEKHNDWPSIFDKKLLDNTGKAKNFNPIENLNNDQFNQNFRSRVQTSKISSSNKTNIKIDEDSKLISSRALSSNNGNFSKYYISYVGLDNLGNTCYM